ncbi:MAG: hypothetical protein ACK5LP_09665 [Campylobacteraceae bacterium]
MTNVIIENNFINKHKLSNNTIFLIVSIATIYYAYFYMFPEALIFEDSHKRRNAIGLFTLGILGIIYCVYKYFQYRKIQNNKFFIVIKNGAIFYDFLNEFRNIDKLNLNVKDIKEITWSYLPIEITNDDNFEMHKAQKNLNFSGRIANILITPAVLFFKFISFFGFIILNKKIEKFVILKFNNKIISMPNRYLKLDIKNIKHEKYIYFG